MTPTRSPARSRASLYLYGLEYLLFRARRSRLEIKFHSQFPGLLSLSSQKGCREGRKRETAVDSARLRVRGKNKLCAHRPTGSSWQNIDFRGRRLSKKERRLFKMYTRVYISYTRCLVYTWNYDEAMMRKNIRAKVSGASLRHLRVLVARREASHENL